MRLNWVPIAALLCTLSAGGCMPDPRPSERPSDPPTQWFLDPNPLRVIGAGDGVEFGEIQGVGTLQDGSVVVVDGSVPSVSAYPASGGDAVRLGAIGSGPGEYREPHLIDILANDDVVVFDPALRRISKYRPDGKLRRSTPWIPSALDSLRSTPVGILPNGEVLAVRMGWPRAEASGQVVRVSAFVDAVDSEGRLQTPYGRYPYGDWLTGMVRETPIVGPRWLGWKLHVAHGGSIVAIGASQTYAIAIFGLDASSLGAIREVTPVRLVSERDREPVLAMAASHHAPPNVTAPETFADTLPAFSTVIVDRHDLVWVSSFPARDEAADSVKVFAANGEWVATLVLPARFRLGAVADSQLVGVVFDSDDAASVVVLKLRRGVGPQ